VEELIQRGLAEPYLLLGWSFGGLVAHEMAVQLRRLGKDMPLLTLLDTHPYSPLRDVADGNVHPRDDEQEALCDLLRFARCDAGGLLPGTIERGAVLDFVRRESPLLAGLHPDVLSAVVDVIINNRRLMFGRTPGLYHGNLLFISASTEDQRSSVEGRWHAFVAGDVEAHTVPAGHDDMLEIPVSAEIVAMLHRKAAELGIPLPHRPASNFSLNAEIDRRRR
jgi:nonribosomal peptide synthetase DhbF